MGIPICRQSEVRKRENAPHAFIKRPEHQEKLRVRRSYRWSFRPKGKLETVEKLELIGKLGQICLLFVTIFAISAMHLASAAPTITAEAQDDGNASVQGSLSLSHLPDNDRDREVGQQANYTILVRLPELPEAAIRNIRVSDTLPVGMRYDNSTLNVTGPAKLQKVTESVGSSSTMVIWNLDEVNRSEDGDIAINYNVTILDVEENRDMAALQNGAELIWTDEANRENSLFDRAGRIRICNQIALPVLNSNLGVYRSPVEMPDGNRSMAIGEMASYTILVNLPNETVSGLWVNDTLPAGLKYDPLSADIANETGSDVLFEGGLPSSPNDGSMPVTINWSFGNISDIVGKRIGITFEATVANAIANQNGAVLDNAAEMGWTNASGKAQTASGHSGPIGIVEPDIEIHLDTRSTEVEPGGIVQYTISVNHTPESTSQAFDLNVTVLVPEGLKIESANPGASAQALKSATWIIPVLNAADTVTINCNATVDASIPEGRIIRSMANATWTSISGASPDERTGNGTALDDYSKTDACEVLVVIPPIYLGDLVWEDANENAVQDTGEKGMAGVAVNLYDPEDNLLNRTATDASGRYNFTGIEPGSYWLEFMLPRGYKFTSQNQGSPELGSDANAITGRTETLNLTDGQNDSTWDAGIYMRTVPPASLGDIVWLDSNENGVQDTDEAGFAKVVVNLYNSKGKLIAMTKTNATGIYNFTNLELGSYSVGIVPPQGYNLTAHNNPYDDSLDSDAYNTTGKTVPVTLIPDLIDSTVDIGLAPKHVALGDLFWIDSNQNGVQESGEAGIVGATVRLHKSTASGEVVANATTNDTGYYEFANLKPGSYWLEFVLPGGYNFTARDQGSSPQMDSDASEADGRTKAITLSPGRDDLSWDAGIYAPKSLLHP